MYFFISNTVVLYFDVKYCPATSLKGLEWDDACAFLFWYHKNRNTHASYNSEPVRCRCWNRHLMEWLRLNRTWLTVLKNVKVKPHRSSWPRLPTGQSEIGRPVESPNTVFGETSSFSSYGSRPSSPEETNGSITALHFYQMHVYKNKFYFGKQVNDLKPFTFQTPWMSFV